MSRHDLQISSKISPHPTFHRQLISTLELLIFIILLLLHSTVGSIGATVAYTTFRAEQFRTFSQVTIDSTTGDVYVTGDSKIYHLSSGLSYVGDTTVASALTDAIECSRANATSACISSINTATVLEIHPEERYLLYCGTVDYGVCSVRYLDNNSNSFVQMNHSIVMNLLGSRQSTVAFFGVLSNMGEQTTALYSAVSYDHRPLHLAPRAVSAKMLVNDQDQNTPRLDYVYENPSLMQRSAIDIDMDVKGQFIVTYVHGFQVSIIIPFRRMLVHVFHKDTLQKRKYCVYILCYLVLWFFVICCMANIHKLHT